MRGRRVTTGRRCGGGRRRVAAGRRGGEQLRDVRPVAAHKARLAAERRGPAPVAAQRGHGHPAQHRCIVVLQHELCAAEPQRERAGQAGAAARNGSEVIDQTLGDIRNIEAAVKDAAEIVGRLDASSAKVNAVVTVIKEVADQTNLLALNAAI